MVSVDRTRSSGAWQLSVGLRFNDYLALEAGGGMLGRFRVTDSIGQDSIQNRLKIADFKLDAIGHLPLYDRFDFTAGAGLARVGVRTEAITGGSATLLAGASPQSSEWRTVLHERLGVGYLLTARLTLTLEFDHYGHLDSATHPTGVSDVGTWSLGAICRF